MKAKVGQCYYAPRGRAFRIYRYVHVMASCTMAVPVDNEPLYRDREEARRRVYELNGWQAPSQPSRGEEANGMTGSAGRTGKDGRDYKL